MTELEQTLQARLDKAIKVFKEKEEQISKLNEKIVELNNHLSLQDEYIDNLKNENERLKNELDKVIKICNKDINNEINSELITKIIPENSKIVNNKNNIFIPVNSPVGFY